MGEGTASVCWDTIDKVQNQIIVIRIRVVFEYASVLVQNPDVTIVIHMNIAQVREMLEGVFIILQLVVDVLLAVVSVHSFVREEPHISFGVLFNGDDSSAAQSVFFVQITVKLGRGCNNSPYD